MIIVIVGPTCSKKSIIAVALAKAIDAEIINGDAFQCYKQLDIGVAKPSTDELQIVPHHLFSFIDVKTPFSIADYQHFLRDKVAQIKNLNKNVIIVGGSGLYIRSSLYDYHFEEMDHFTSEKYDSLTNDELHKILEIIDPVEAVKLHKNNRKRVIRALEIYDKAKLIKLNKSLNKSINLSMMTFFL